MTGFNGIRNSSLVTDNRNIFYGPTLNYFTFTNKQDYQKSLTLFLRLLSAEWHNPVCLEVRAANERNVELNTRKEISYLQATTYYFVYHINTITLYWQDKSTLLINENKRIAKRWIKIVKYVGAKAQDENMRCNITTTNNRRNFPYTKSSDSDLVLTDRRNPSGTRLRSACGKSFSCRFSFSAARNAISKATEKVTFGIFFPYFCFFSF